MPKQSGDFEPAPQALFDWDTHNISHIAAHSVSPLEAEQVIVNDPLEFDFDAEINGEDRWTYLGETDRGRLLMVIITIRGDKVRVVTSFEPERRDKLTYLETKAGWNDDNAGS